VLRLASDACPHDPDDLLECVPGEFPGPVRLAGREPGTYYFFVQPVFDEAPEPIRARIDVQPVGG